MNFEHFLVTLPGLFWICLLVPALLALVGVILARKIIGFQNKQQYHSIATAALSPVASVFGIMAAFIVATTWSQYSTIKKNINEENNTLQSLYLNTQAFPPEFAQQARTLYRLYRTTILENEWKVVQKGKDTFSGDVILEDLIKLYSSYTVKNEKEFAFFQLSINRLDRLNNLRQQRIDDASSTTLPLLWVLFLLGAVTMVAMSFLMVSSNAKVHGGFSMLLAMVIGLMIYAIVSINLPFAGAAKISDQSFTDLSLGEN